MDGLDAPQEMKTLMATMFILGIPWALLVGGVILSPLGVFLPEYRHQAHDVVFSLLASACGLTGFFIWLGYRLRWSLGRFPWLTKRKFWSLSIAHHVAWVFLLPWGFSLGFDHHYWKVFADFWIGDGPNLFRIWIIVSLLISFVALIFDQEPVHAEESKAEQAAS